MRSRSAVWRNWAPVRNLVGLSMLTPSGGNRPSRRLRLTRFDDQCQSQGARQHARQDQDPQPPRKPDGFCVVPNIQGRIDLRQLRLHKQQSRAPQGGHDQGHPGGLSSLGGICGDHRRLVSQDGRLPGGDG